MFACSTKREHRACRAGALFIDVVVVQDPLTCSLGSVSVRAAGLPRLAERQVVVALRPAETGASVITAWQVPAVCAVIEPAAVALEYTV